LITPFPDLVWFCCRRTGMRQKIRRTHLNQTFVRHGSHLALSLSQKFEAPNLIVFIGKPHHSPRRNWMILRDIPRFETTYFDSWSSNLSGTCFHKWFKDSGLRISSYLFCYCSRYIRYIMIYYYV
jgi:hypothetical protein